MTTEQLIPWDALLAQAVEQGASRLHLAPGARPLIRVGEALQPLDLPPLDAESIEAIARACAEMAGVDPDWPAFSPDASQAERRFAFTMDERVRVVVHQLLTATGPALAVKLHPAAVPVFETLGLPPALSTALDARQGLIVISGGRRSGRTTTLAASLDAINRRRGVQIVALASPVEFVHEPRQSIVFQRELGRDGARDGAALEARLTAALQSDADVVAIDDLPEPIPLKQLLAAAEAGLLLLIVLNAPDVISAVRRLLEGVPPDDQDALRKRLADNLLAVCSQRLVTSPTISSPAVAVERLIATPVVRSLIAEGKLSALQSAMQTGAKYGMATMDDALRDLGLAGRSDEIDRVPSSH